ncbi:MAG: alpha/beta hydrolase [Pseudolabrys sp.]|nr:alpha/beta hydrolase [Pseudolabrys sp.]
MISSSIRLRLLGATAILALGLASAQAQTPAPATMPNVASATQPAKADADMQKVLDTLASLNGKPVESLSPAEARKQPTPTDAVMKIIKDEKLKVDPHAGLKVSNSRFADMGNLRLRYYTPENATKDSKLPVVVYFRGGGWVIADLDVYDSSPAAIARKANAIVVSVDYPMAPENKFPAAHDEAVEAYKYIAKNAAGWGGDPAKIAIVGESAGGNLAINAALAANAQNLAKPVAVVAVYPVASNSLELPSKKQYAAAKPLNTPMLAWFFDKVLANPDQKNDHRLDLVSANLKGLPPVTIINAEIDPLKSDGDMLTEKLKAAGVQVTQKVYTGVTHEFFGMDAVVAKAAEAQDFAVTQLKQGFTGGATMGSAPAK